MAGANLKTFSATDWEQEVLGSEKAVLVDFWAPWCKPCLMLSPIVDELADEYLGRITVGKLNVEEHGEVAKKYGIMSIPALAIFKGGQIVDKAIGFRSKADLVKRLEQYA